MPRKMSGREMRTMDWLMNTIRVPRVTVASAIQRYDDWRLPVGAAGPEPLPLAKVVALTP